jgi:hypothetical protein
LQHTKVTVNKVSANNVSANNVSTNNVSTSTDTDVYMVLPKGRRGFLWITYWRTQHLAIVIPLHEQDGRMDLPHIRARPCCFSTELALGTVLYGTQLSVLTDEEEEVQLFCCENIYYCRGFPVGHHVYAEKLQLLQDLFSHHIRQLAYTKEFIVLGLPVLKQSYAEALHAAQRLPYPTRGITLFSVEQVHPTGTYSISSNATVRLSTSTSLSKSSASPAAAAAAAAVAVAVAAPAVSGSEAIFLVKALPGMDSYNLYCNASQDPYGLAMVSSYNCSVLLNRLFRTIKENTNLDLLEESDDESEFQDVRDNKFVDVNKAILMKCVFSKRFRKWQPIGLARPPLKIVSFKEAQYLEHKR